MPGSYSLSDIVVSCELSPSMLSDTFSKSVTFFSASSIFSVSFATSVPFSITLVVLDTSGIAFPASNASSPILSESAALSSASDDVFRASSAPSPNALNASSVASPKALSTPVSLVF